MEKYINQSNYYFYGEYPNKCPMCKNNISPDRKNIYVNEDLELVDIHFSCPACGKSFIARYSETYDDIVYSSHKHKIIHLNETFPNIPNEIIFDDRIIKLSKKFVEIFNQSHKAQIFNLNEIAGMGYRKSLEFLIKDYCIYKNADEEGNIKKMPLSQVIEKYVESDKIKVLSKASAWIGNDETHYVREWNDKCIEDMKLFIKSIVAFITYDLSVDDATNMIETKG